jgi:hypothetical protein
MSLVILLVLGVLAAIGALTLIAISCVIRFGDDAFADMNTW